jgi:viroplasmin and RNaseH domain-containing protein
MKWYVVYKGRKPGVYSDWNMCQAQVSGFSHASYKSFKSKEDAMKAYKMAPEITEYEEDAAVYKMAPEITKTYNFQAFNNTATLVMIVVLLSAVVLKLYCS